MKRRWLLLLLLVVLVVLLLGVKGVRLWGRWRSLQAQLAQMEALAQGKADIELKAVGEALRQAHADLQAIKSEVAFILPLTPHLGWLPRVGGDLAAAPALLDIALSVTEAGVVAFDGLEPLMDLAEGDSTGDPPLVVVVETLEQARPQLETAQALLGEALERRGEVDTAALSPRLAGLMARLDRYLPLMQTAFDGALVAPTLLGAEGRRTYLVLAQNNDELRATGGFISAVGSLTLERGEMGDLVFADSYTVDDFSQPYPDSPPPMLRYMGIDQWVFRDANWSPDWPTAAQQAIALCRVGCPPEVDGVISADQRALQFVVEALAPLEVEGWPEAVTGENVLPLIRMAWSPTDVEDWSGWDPDWWRQRKQFIGDLVGAMRHKLEATPDQIDWVALGRAVLRALDERHLQIWLSDAEGPAARLLAERGWDGALRSRKGDYLLVIDTNLGYNKASAVVQARLEYQVVVDIAGEAQATLVVQHEHPLPPIEECVHPPHYGRDYEDMVRRCYWNYLRVYAPGGSQLVAATRHSVPSEWLVTGQAQENTTETLPPEKGKAVWATFFVLPPGQEVESRFVYQLPPGTVTWDGEQGRYRLWVQKQAGTDAVPLRVTLRLPPGAGVEAIVEPDGADPEVTVRQPEAGTIVWETTLNVDRSFDVIFQREDKRER